MVFSAIGKIRDTRKRVPGMTLTQAILLHLASEHEGITMHETQLLTGFPQSTVSRTYTELARRAWPGADGNVALVTLQPHETNRRQLAVFLTGQGAAAVKG